MSINDQKMQIALHHPTGNRNVRAVLDALLKADMLGEFNTAVAVNPESDWLKLLPASIRREFLRRTFIIPSNKLKTHPFLELARMILPRIGLHQAVRHEFGWASVDSVYKNMDLAVAKRLPYLVKSKKIEAVYAYEDGALETFRQAKKLGLHCIYDLPIAFWETGRKLMAQEAQRLPHWAGTLGGGIKDSTAKLERKTQELELADIITGPGEFVMDSLPAWAQTKKRILAPFGSPEPGIVPDTKFKNFHNLSRPLRVLFAGSMGQRKGLGDLFNAIKLLNSPNIELVVMGSMLAPMKFYRNELANFTYEAGRPHHQVLELMQTCDIFCLPSIVEGRALVMQEAMSQGLPLIITPNTGGSDLIMEGLTGFLVPIRSPEAIAEKLAWFMDNPGEIPKMGLMARDHASEYTWEKYGTAIVNSLYTNTYTNTK